MEFREQPATSFEEAERRYAELQLQLEAGQIDDEEFDVERQRLMVRDEQGRWWAKSRESGAWLYHDGSAWSEGTPPLYPHVGHEDSPGAIAPDPVTRSGGRTVLVLGSVLAVVLVVMALVIGFVGLSLTGEIVEESQSANEKQEENKDEVTPAIDPPKPRIESKAAAASSDASSREELVSVVEDYYKAVDRQDWNYVYDNNDSQTKQKYTRDEYVRKNQYLAGVDPVAKSSPAIPPEISTSSPVEVTLSQTFESGLTNSRVTYFVWEDGAWKHRFSEEDDAIFLPNASYDEFVTAKQSGG